MKSFPITFNGIYDPTLFPDLKVNDIISVRFFESEDGKCGWKGKAKVISRTNKKIKFIGVGKFRRFKER